MSSSQRENLLERLASKIPGYGGYLNKERRRDLDKRQREQLADKLKQMRSSLNNLLLELTEQKRLFETGSVERAASKIDKLENRIRFASYGYSGFFDVVKIEEAELDKLYQFDLSLEEDIEKIGEKISALPSENGDGLKSAVASLEKELDSLDKRFSERHKAIENVGK